MTENILQRFKTIKAFIFDMDGVLTPGSLICLENGELQRTFNIKDGYALHIASEKYPIAIISGATNSAAKLRLEKLGIQNIFMGVDAKLAKLTEWLLEIKIHPSEVLYMGDDVLDLECIKSVGLGACPADAVQDVIEVASYISPFKGGEGCARDVIEKVMKLRGNWPVIK